MVVSAGASKGSGRLSEGVVWFSSSRCEESHPVRTHTSLTNSWKPQVTYLQRAGVFGGAAAADWLNWDGDDPDWRGVGFLLLHWTDGSLQSCRDTEEELRHLSRYFLSGGGSLQQLLL